MTQILFMTFTRNLAIDIENNLSTLCSTALMKRIEVTNLDLWVHNFLRSQNYDYTIVFGSDSTQDYWDRAILEKPIDLDLSEQFLREEWQHVIQPQSLTTLDQYKKASRIGRGTRLTRRDRVAVWPVFEEYRYQLAKARLKEIDDAYRDAAELISSRNISLPYCSVIIDEAQDMGSQAFKLFRAIVPERPNDLFVAGDAHQRIYGRNRIVLGQCGINIRGRCRKLKINYRTTDEIRRWAIRLLEGRHIDDLDGGKDDNSVYKSLTHGEVPQIEEFDTPKTQAGFIKALLDNSEEPNASTCVVARTNAKVEEIQKQLERLEVATIIIKPREADNKTSNAVRLATVHRVKGLEFDQLVLASANDELVPLNKALQNKADNASLEDAETEERSLVYVAVTRARKKAFVLSDGSMSRFFKS